jgi:CO/xanthine dehydrogenase Mo-binding subunit
MANATFDATGYRFRQTPFRRDTIWRALNSGPEISS